MVVSRFFAKCDQDSWLPAWLKVQLVGKAGAWLAQVVQRRQRQLQDATGQPRFVEGAVEKQLLTATEDASVRIT